VARANKGKNIEPAACLEVATASQVITLQRNQQEAKFYQKLKVDIY